MKQTPTISQPTLSTIAQSVELLQQTADSTQASIHNLMKAINGVKAETKHDISQLRVDVQADIKSSADQLARSVKVGFDDVDKQLMGIDERFNKLDGRVGHIENVMVTKDYLDSKLSTYKGEQTMVAKREDRKLITVVNLLEKKQIFTHQEAGSILAMEPFAR